MDTPGRTMSLRGASRRSNLNPAMRDCFTSRATTGRRFSRVSFRLWAALIVVLSILLLSGCKGKETQTDAPPQTQAVNTTEVTAMQNALTKGMTPIAFTDLTNVHVGRRCVIVSPKPDSGDPPPPPLGMVRRLGPTTIYAAEIHEVLAASVKIRATYPTSGNMKIIELPRAAVQSIHIAP